VPTEEKRKRAEKAEKEDEDVEKKEKDTKKPRKTEPCVHPCANKLKCRHACCKIALPADYKPKEVTGTKKMSTQMSRQKELQPRLLQIGIVR